MSLKQTSNFGINCSAQSTDIGRIQMHFFSFICRLPVKSLLYKTSDNFRARYNLIRIRSLDQIITILKFGLLVSDECLYSKNVKAHSYYYVQTIWVKLIRVGLRVSFWFYTVSLPYKLEYKRKFIKNWL